MDRARWQRLSAILDRAVEFAPEARAQYLEKACGSDAALRIDAEELLAAAGAPDDFLASPAAEQAAPLVASAGLEIAPALVGQTIGAYRLVGELGEGGMGVVYLAERADGQFEHQVAIKLLKQGVHGVAARRRFLAERQLLARLRHPAIAHLLDGGVTRDGVPYFVMEYVEGVPVTAYCRERALDLDHRLRVFLDVCEAVQYAHQHLIVHRDLKPSNILVDGAGRVKLLDFGIAKLVGGAGSARVEHTLTLARVMTPEHAAPEQVRGDPVSPSTDVYALGVLLYELLTGNGPYRIRTGTLGEVERAILEQEPTPPSARLPQNAGGGHDRRRLRGDIDRIVLKAMAKDPDRRYASAEALAADIRRHLEGLPVTAQGDALMYRARRFTRRHRVGLSAAALVLLALVAGLVATSWQVRRGTLARATPAVASSLGTAGSQGTAAPQGIAVTPRRSVAVMEFRNVLSRPEQAWLATAIPEMLSTELAAGEKLRLIPGEDVARMKRELHLENAGALTRDAAVRAGNNLRVDLLVVGSYAAVGSAPNRRVRIDLRLQDATNGEVMTEVAETGTERYLFELVSKAGNRVRERLGVSGISSVDDTGLRASLPTSPDAARLYAAGIARLRVLDAIGARDLLEQAIAVEPRFPLSHMALMSAWKLLGYDQRARTEAKKAFDLSAGLPRPDRLRIEGRYHEMAGEIDKAIAAYRALFALAPDSLEDGLLLAGAQGLGGHRADSLATVDALHRLPEPLSSDPRIDMEQARYQDDVQQYLALVRRAAEKANRQGAPLLQAKAEVMECNALHTLGQSKEAVNACEAALRIFSEARTPRQVAETTRFLGDIRHNEGRLAAAMDLHRQALKIDQTSRNERGCAVSFNELSMDYEALGDLKQAEQLYRQSYALFLKVGDRFNAAVLAFNVGGTLLSLGKLSEAQKLLDRSLSLARESGGRNAESAAHDGLAELAFVRGNLERARQHAETSVAQKQRGGDRFAYVAGLGLLAKIVAAQGDLTVARQRGTEALGIAEEIRAEGESAERRLLLAQLDLEEGRVSQAEPAIRRALAVFLRERMRDDALEAYSALSRCLLMQGKAAEAHTTINQAHEIYVSSQNQAKRLQFAITEARVKAAQAINESRAAKSAPSYREAQSELVRHISDARALGLVGLEYEARLAAGELMMQADPTATQTKEYVTSLARDAHAHGFELIASKAAKLIPNS